MASAIESPGYKAEVPLASCTIRGKNGINGKRLLVYLHKEYFSRKLGALGLQLLGTI